MADTVLIQGDTYPVRNELKALGGTWDKAARGWRVPADRAAEAKELVEDAGDLPFGQLWQECFCGSEPVCVQCERCARHCGCRRGRPSVSAPLASEPYGHGANGRIDP